MDREVIHTLRLQAWERAKGEIAAMLHTFWPEEDAVNKFERMDEKAKKFISEVEDNSLCD